MLAITLGFHSQRGGYVWGETFFVKPVPSGKQRCYIILALCYLRNVVWEKNVVKYLDKHSVLETEVKISHVT